MINVSHSPLLESSPPPPRVSYVPIDATQSGAGHHTSMPCPSSFHTRRFGISKALCDLPRWFESRIDMFHNISHVSILCFNMRTHHYEISGIPWSVKLYVQSCGLYLSARKRHKGPRSVRDTACWSACIAVCLSACLSVTEVVQHLCR